MTTTSPESTATADIPPAQPRRKSPWGAIEDAVLTVLAAIGVVCIIATIAAFAFGISLIMFKTGSMSPTIPTGSLAVVREVPASELKPGDVATVSRGENQLPVTHRVLSVTPAAGDQYEITMKGDANSGPDPRPYHVSTAKKVIWHAPELSKYIVKFGTPQAMAGITIAATLLVVWAFWPRKQH